ncbi:hypothetical protein AKG60_09420 [Vibrio parahaemolyticus]|uniref:Uncharacterized protein n=1 Tax=Vibrio parahaemolyticus TaxID=670 RepID=A0AAX0MCJ8_VIBPH|nr:hypothetical protein [Vibrio parahaemolyticus]MCS0330987.1 hypothetical protein [Vibrio diabolicus]EGQ8892101.1 hypothetical protein [Vibrio parahaemolyticus]EGR3309158.1 hypothetical protein [Vibrio parahaemolyticus]EJG0024007.1 hypothetical protein [Vibrio parahaemolyticus]
MRYICHDSYVDLSTYLALKLLNSKLYSDLKSTQIELVIAAKQEYKSHKHNCPMFVDTLNRELESLRFHYSLYSSEQYYLCLDDKLEEESRIKAKIKKQSSNGIHLYQVYRNHLSLLKSMPSKFQDFLKIVALSSEGAISIQAETQNLVKVIYREIEYIFRHVTDEDGRMSIPYSLGDDIRNHHLKSVVGKQFTFEVGNGVALPYHYSEGLSYQDLRHYKNKFDKTELSKVLLIEMYNFVSDMMSLLPNREAFHNEMISNLKSNNMLSEKAGLKVLMTFHERFERAKSAMDRLKDLNPNYKLIVAS